MPERRHPPERRSPFVVEEAKFDTQRIISYVVLGIFIGATVVVLLGQDPAERSTVIQTIIIYTTTVVTYWLGAAKQQNGTPKPAAPVAVETVKADDVKVQAEGNVTVQPKGEKP